MKLISWLRTLGQPIETLPANTYVPLLDDSGTTSGALVVHSDAAKDLILHALESTSLDSSCPHNGYLSSYMFDQLSRAAPIVNASVQSGKLLQVVGQPEVLAAIKSGTMTIMRSSVDNSMMSQVVNSVTKRIVDRVGYAPAGCAPIVAPLAVLQILNAVAGVAHLQKINARLDTLQRGIERITFRLQAT